MIYPLLHILLYGPGFSLFHRCKNMLTPKIKKTVKKRAFIKNIKNMKKRWIKDVDKLAKLIKANEKFSSKITVLVCMTTFEATALHKRIFFTAAMLNPSPKSRFMQEFSRFNRILAGLVG